LSLRDQVDTSSPIGRVMFTITAAFAELEREVIQERVRAGVQRARAAGKHCGRPRKTVSDQQMEVAQDLLAAGAPARDEGLAAAPGLGSWKG
jgi:DNA invertase Pin-like site-specific DNA recombinase